MLHNYDSCVEPKHLTMKTTEKSP